MGGSVGDIPNYENSKKTLLKLLEEDDDCIVEDRNNWEVQGFTDVKDDSSVDDVTQTPTISSSKNSFKVKCVSRRKTEGERRREKPPYAPKVVVYRIGTNGLKTSDE